MLLKKLKNKELIHPPSWLVDNTHYLTIMGSNAYGVSSDNSDFDIYGFCMPPLSYLFPNAHGGEIEGFGRQKKRFDQWQEHHIRSPDSITEYDFAVYNIAKYFQLCMENNPNMIDSIFTPERCVIQSTPIGQMVRDKRKIFLHKGLKHKFVGYAFSQKNKMKVKEHHGNEKRRKSIEELGYDTKYAYHLVRLLLEAEQALNEGDLNLERNTEILKSIRRGEWTLTRIDDFFEKKSAGLESAYDNSKLPNIPDEEKIKELLMNCIEHHYGTISKTITKEGSLLDDLKELLDKHS